MEFFDRINQVAKSAAGKATEALGTGKIAVRIKKEEYLIGEQYQKIGEYYYNQRSAGVALAPEVDEFCLAIDLSKAAIAELQEQLQTMKTAQEAEPEVIIYEEPVHSEFEVRSCPHCGAPVSIDAVFCGKCGERLN